MNGEPSNAPDLRRPATDAPIERVTAILSAVAGDLVASVQALYDQVVECLDNAAVAYSTCAARIHGVLAGDLASIEGCFGDVATCVSNTALANLGMADILREDLGIPGLAPEEIQRRAAGLDFPGGGLPPVPEPRIPIGGQIPQPVREGQFGGTGIGFPVLPPIPNHLVDFGRPIGKVGGPTSYVGTPNVSIGDERRRFGEPSKPTTPATPSSSTPATPPPFVQPPLLTAPPPAGGVQQITPVPPRPATSSATADEYLPISGDNGNGRRAEDASGQDLSGYSTAGASAGGNPCPPPVVTVNVHCAPGVTATQGTGPQAGTLNTTTTTTSSTYVDYTEEEQRKIEETREAFLGIEAESTLALWLRENFGAVKGETPEARAKRERQIGETIDAWVKRVKGLDVCTDVPNIDAAVKGAVKAFWQWLSGTDEGVGIKSPSVLGSVVDAMPSVVRDPVRAVLSILVGAGRSTQILGAAITGCDSPTYLVVAGLRALYGVVEKWIGASFPEVGIRLDQAAGQICAVGLPGPGEAHTAWLVDEIDDATWRCWVRAAGVNDGPAALIRSALQSRPNVDQMVQWCRRQGLSREESRPQMRSVGVVDEWVQWAWWGISEYVPGASDLVTFMTRDVFDEAVVTKYGYDEAFAEKFSGKAKEWAYVNGATEEQFRYFWRAHWRLISPTQGYEMIHRLRPGRVDDGLVTDKETIRELLEIDDYPKYWRDRLIEISYHPLTRTDTQRAFNIGALSADETYQAILDQGYNERDAKILLRFWTAQKADWVARQPWARDYLSGMVPVTRMMQELDRRGYTEGERNEAIKRMDRQVAAKQEITTVKALRQRWLRGLITEVEARVTLRDLGFSSEQYTALLGTWDRERKARGKQASTAMLCDWHDKGFISPAEYSTALSNLGYSAGDVTRILKTCNAKSTQKAKQQAKVEAATMKREITEQEKATRRDRSAKALELARAARAARVRQTAEERVQRRLGIAQATLKRHLQIDNEAASAAVLKWFADLIGPKGYSREGASLMIGDVLIDLAGRSGKDWQQRVDDYLAGLVPMEPAPSPPAETGRSAGGEANGVLQLPDAEKQ